VVPDLDRGFLSHDQWRDGGAQAEGQKNVVDFHGCLQLVLPKGFGSRGLRDDGPVNARVVYSQERKQCAVDRRSVISKQFRKRLRSLDDSLGFCQPPISQAPILQERLCSLPRANNVRLVNAPRLRRAPNLRVVKTVGTGWASTPVQAISSPSGLGLDVTRELASKRKVLTQL
jgi:hypothetical protein